MGVALFALSLWAADFWQSKPYTDWNDKEIQKILQSSPWAKQMSITLPGGAAPGQGGGRGRGGNPPTGSDSGGFGSAGGGPAGTNGDSGGLGRYAGSRGDPGLGDAGVAPTTTIVVRWQSSLAVREAIVKAKFGEQAGASADAKKAVETAPDHYVIAVVGVPEASFRGMGDDLKKTMIEKASLAVKGKDALKPDDFKIEEKGRMTELLFAFPKATEISADDKEVEFAVKIGGMNIREKFRLKDMMFHGKLEL